MTPEALKNMIAQLLVDNPHPLVNQVGLSDSGNIRIDAADNSAIYVTLAHAGPATAKPSAPAWQVKW